jgi:hypothetical protein
MNTKRIILITILCNLSCIAQAQEKWNSKYIKEKNGRLEYIADSLGNTIPDFSRVGYRENSVPVPVIKVVKTVSPSGTDNDLPLLQSAIDEVSKMPANKDGFRGAVLLTKGIYKIPGTLRISASGIVLRGEKEETRLIATGKGQRTLIIARGTGNVQKTEGSEIKITDKYVPVGAKSFTLQSTKGLKKGDSIMVYRPATAQWIADIKMDQIQKRDSTIRQWDPAEYGLHFERVITRIEKNKVFIDNPVVMAMEEKYGGGSVYLYRFNGRINNVGIEDLVCESEYAGDTDEDHGWDAIHMNRLENGWVKNVTAKYFGYSCVNLGYQSRNITVEYCSFLSPKSTITGGRRYSFNNDGQLNLFRYCFSSEGRHDYVTGARVCGPNVFYQCKAEKTKADIGPHHRWAVGTLYDNIITDGEINVQDRGNWGTGHGWAGANQVVWNCTVSQAAIQNPWTSAKNYAYWYYRKNIPGKITAQAIRGMGRVE